MTVGESDIQVDVGLYLESTAEPFVGDAWISEQTNSYGDFES